ncbi:MAG: c-type cytochrome [Gemmatimonadota bacterium]|nr:c-type cytochrome [Gemmatimonadota bacterium]
MGYLKAGFFAAAMILALGLPATTQAQEGFQNLQVLPQDIPRRNLTAVMRNFAIGLGVRCSYCHVGEEGQPLSEYDFASDEKEAKVIARDMLRMVSAINGEHLASLNVRNDPPVRVNCATCHHGNNLPITLADHLWAVFQENGAEAVVPEFDELKTRYYGSWTYDFSEGSLNDLAATMIDAEEFDAALLVLTRNLSDYPESARIFAAIGESYLGKADTVQAVSNLQRSLELNPGNQAISRLLDRISGNDR